MAKSSKKSSTAGTKTAKTTSKRSFIHLKIRKGKSEARKAKKLPKPEPRPVHLSSVWQLSRKSVLVLWHNKGIFIGISAVYGVLDLVLAEGLVSSTAIVKLKGEMTTLVGGHASSIASGFSTFITLGSTGNATTNSGAAVYQFFLVIIISLASIWALRQVVAEKQTKLRIRDAYYRGMYPLIPFILTLLIIGLQLVPLIVGATLYTVVVNNGIAVGVFQKFFWVIVFAVLTCYSLFMICGSAFSLYIVSLPNMQPVKAVRAASRLAYHHRSLILQRLMFLPFALLIIALAIIIPITLWLTPLAKPVYFLMTIFVIPVTHSYLFNLYRELSGNND